MCNGQPPTLQCGCFASSSCSPNSVTLSVLGLHWQSHKVDILMAKCALWHHLDIYSQHLSGGETQRETPYKNWPIFIILQLKNYYINLKRCLGFLATTLQWWMDCRRKVFLLRQWVKWNVNYGRADRVSCKSLGWGLKHPQCVNWITYHSHWDGGPQEVAAPQTPNQPTGS